MSRGKQAWRNRAEWHKARAKCITSQTFCDVCKIPFEDGESVHVHHVQDASYHPTLRYKQSNLKPLHRKCHMTMYHILFKGETRKKTSKKDYRKFKAIANYYMKLEK